MFVAGVYAITHVASGQRYIGSSKNVHARWHYHRKRLRKGASRHTRLQEAWSEYGEAAFSFVVLEIVSDAFLLLDREQFWMDNTPLLLNASRDARRPTLGMPMRETTRQKLKDAHAQQFAAPGSRQAHNLLIKAALNRPEVKQKRSEARYLAFETTDLRQKVSAGVRAHLATEEGRQKVRDAQSKRWADPEERRKQSERTRAYFERKRAEQAQEH